MIKPTNRKTEDKIIKHHNLTTKNKKPTIKKKNTQIPPNFIENSKRDSHSIPTKFLPKKS